MRLWPFLRDNGEEVSSAPEGNPREDQGDLFGMDCFLEVDGQFSERSNFCGGFFRTDFSRWWFQIFFYFHPYLGK